MGGKSGAHIAGWEDNYGMKMAECLANIGFSEFQESGEIGQRKRIFKHNNCPRGPVECAPRPFHPY